MMLDKFRSWRGVRWIIANWQLALAVLGALVLTHTAVYFVGRDHGDDSAMVEVTNAANKANDLATESAGQAAAEGEIEQGEILNDKEKADEAVHLSNDDSGASIASLARMCELVRRSGQDLDGFSACQSGASAARASPRPE